MIVHLKFHPTQKPEEMIEYFIKTYSNEGEVILDNCMGSGSTCIACINTNRQYIGIEKDTDCYEVAKDWIETYLYMRELQGVPMKNWIMPLAIRSSML